MQHPILKYTTTLLLILVCWIGYGQKHVLTSDSKISILTCGTSTELHSLFGHTGIRIQDKNIGLDLVYNYGAFDFAAPNFYGKFIKGDLLYFIGLDDFNSFLFNYQAENRSVWEQDLNLTLQVKQAIFSELVLTYGTEKALYTYKFIDKNCTTLAKDLIEKHAGLQLSMDLADSDKSHRVILNNYLKNAYLPGFGINLAFGAKTDKKLTHVFLPHQLLESIEKTSINKQPLSEQTREVFKAHENKVSNLPTILILTAIFIVLGFLTMYKSFAVFFYFVLGLFSIFIFGLQFYSYHQEVHLNYNLLLINPLFLFLVFYLLTDQYKKLKKILHIVLGCFVIYVAVTLYNNYIFMVFPIMLGILISLIISIKLYKKV